MMIGLVIIALVVVTLLPLCRYSSICTTTGACKATLTRIQAAKQGWALTNHKNDDDVPNENDLFGTDRLMDPPICPKGGAYTLNAVGQQPACSVRGHQLE